MLTFFSAKSLLAAQFEPMGKAVEKILGTKKAKMKSEKSGGEDVKFFAPEKGSGKYACVAKGLYPPDCTHTWAIGFDSNKLTVGEIRPIEMSCHHAYPTKENGWFFKQFKGKGTKDLVELKDHSFRKVAKATGSSELTGDAIVKCLEVAQKLKKESW